MPRCLGYGVSIRGRIAERIAAIASSWAASFFSSELSVGGQQLAPADEGTQLILVSAGVKILFVCLGNIDLAYCNQ